MDIHVLSKQMVMSALPFSFGFSRETDTSEVKPLDGTLLEKQQAQFNNKYNDTNTLPSSDAKLPALLPN